MLRLSDQTIELRTYGVDIEQVDQFASIISKLLSWARSRSQLLQQVLHQKMGLYAHSTTALSTKTTVVVEGGGRHSGVGSTRTNRSNKVRRTLQVFNSVIYSYPSASFCSLHITTLHNTTQHYTTLHNTTLHYTSRCRRRCRRCRRCTTKEWKVLCCGRPRNNDPCPKQLLRILRILRMLCNTGCLGRRRSRTTTRMTLRYVPHVPLSCKYTCSRGPWIFDPQ